MKQLAVLIAFTGFLSLLASCSSIKGVTISEPERAACEVQGCSVWTLDQIKALFLRGAQAGYEKGYSDGKSLL